MLTMLFGLVNMLTSSEDRVPSPTQLTIGKSVDIIDIKETQFRESVPTH